MNRTAQSTNCGSHVKRVLTLSDVLTLTLAFSLFFGHGEMLRVRESLADLPSVSRTCITHFKRKVSLEEQKAQKEDRFLRGRQTACLLFEYFWVTGANDSVENFADLFKTVLRNNDQEFDSKWDEILLSMTQIPI